MVFVEIIPAIKTNNVSLLKISMLVEIVSKILPQLNALDNGLVLSAPTLQRVRFSAEQGLKVKAFL